MGQQAIAGNGGVAYPEADRSVRPILQLAASAPAVPHQLDHTAPPAEPAPRAEPEPAPAQAPTPHPAPAKDPEVREWAKRYQVPDVPARGRVPAHIRTAYEAFQEDERGPWKALLQKAGINPTKALATARRLTAVDSAKQAAPTQEEIDRKTAELVGKLSGAQLTHLREMFGAPDGRATANRKTKTSFEALMHRGCCTLITDDEETSTYEITNVGRLWFNVRGIDPADA
ncbi:Lsr2 family DNA-binding protein [Streptomyces sp. NBC_01451]|uniref:Lsr2 family DNA-binding protein n=1 Tax=Streptomyces sp. NBC_01451 TaxID=2903872 RepID=UPI002E33CE56|nr:hypothetical protein [Streptomyces sp. NBC_01451]